MPGAAVAVMGPLAAGLPLLHGANVAQHKGFAALNHPERNMRPALAVLALALLAAAPLRAAPADDFHRLLADHYQWLLRENPVEATALGVRTYDALLADPSLAAEDRRAAE